jgi:hypothetical protein
MKFYNSCSTNHLTTHTSQLSLGLKKSPPILLLLLPLLVGDFLQSWLSRIQTTSQHFSPKDKDCRMR